MVNDMSENAEEGKKATVSLILLTGEECPRSSENDDSFSKRFSVFLM